MGMGPDCAVLMLPVYNAFCCSLQTGAAIFE